MRFYYIYLKKIINSKIISVDINLLILNLKGE